MLRPDERAHLLELLRPPAGCQLDLAVGTTFSLDLTSALMLPLSFAFFDWEQEDGQPVADPLALLEALRRYGTRLSIFCQAGQIRLPPKYQPLVTFLEPCVYEVQPPDNEGVFHPKVWALRFVDVEGSVRYRVLCLSRNLTFDRCWDTVVSLDGELVDRSNAIAANHPLSDLIEALPKMALRRLVPERREQIKKIADELRRVRFEWPEGFDERECRFWVAGLSGKPTTPFGERRDQCLIVSPFIKERVVRDFLEYGGPTHLISRLETIQDLSQATLQECDSVHYLQPQLTEDSTDETTTDQPGEVLEGLHAKLFVIDRGWDASVFSGSFNATVHALEHNVEFMVELVGKKSRFGVEQFLLQVKGETSFADLLQKYDINLPPSPSNPAEKLLDQLFQSVKRALAEGDPRVHVTPNGDPDLFDLNLTWSRPLRLPTGQFEIRAWPITQHAERSLPLDGQITFRRVSYEGLTPLFAFSISASVSGIVGQSVFVTNLPMEGAPTDRQERLLAALLAGRDQLLRYIFFLLAAGDESATSPSDLADLLGDSNGHGKRSAALTCLLESLLRTLHRQPTQLKRVADLLDDLHKAPNGSELLSNDFQRIWEPIWKAAQETLAK